jgi:hypothetical protein
MKAKIALTPSQNQLLRMHWSKRRTAKKNIAWELMKHFGKVKHAPRKARVAITRMTVGVEPDPDNLVAANKLILDALQDINAIEDDTSDCISLSTKWEKAESRKDQGVIVEVEKIWDTGQS